MDLQSLLTRHLRNPAAFAADVLRIPGSGNLTITRDDSDSKPETLTYGAPRWDVVARIEDDRSEFHEDDRITTKHLDEMIQTFDPEHRRVPWIAGLRSDKGPGDASPSHWSVGPPIAEVVELDRDRINLWAKTLPIIDPSTGKDRFSSIVAKGYTERSIGFALGGQETRGQAQLVHVAALSMAESPGIPNMPRLDRIANSAQLLKAFGQSLPEIDLSRVAQDWSLLGGQPYEGIALRSRVFLNSSASEAEEDFQVGLTQEQEDTLSRLMSKMEEVGENVTKSNETLDSLTERVAKSEERADEFEQKLEDAATEVAEAKADAEEKEEEERSKSQASFLKRVKTATEGAVRSGRQRGKIETLLRALPEADALTEKDVALFEAALDVQPIVVGRNVIEEVRTEGGESVQINLRDYQLGDGESEISPEGLQQVSELMAETGFDPSAPHDPEKFRAFEQAALRRERMGHI